MPNEKNRRDKQRDDNRDPITKAPGAHPVGTGFGAAAGGAAGAAAGAAAGTALGGPVVGTAAGIAVGAVAGGLGGKAVAEQVNPTAEDAYWRENYRREPYYNAQYSYDDYQPAYRTGYEGYGRLRGKRWHEAEPELRREYESKYRNSRLKWADARHATRAAWQRFDRNLEDYVGYTVVDRNDSKIGTLQCLWSDHTGEPSFIGVSTGWVFGKTHVVPADNVHVNEDDQRIRLPYTEEQVKRAPAYDADVEFSEPMERDIYGHYGVTRQTQRSRSTGGTAAERASMPLMEEQVKIGKRQVEAGGVRLRKVVRTETVNQPVQLQREEIIIERVPAGQGASSQHSGAFEGREIYVPLRREEAVVAKEQRVTEEVRVRKESHTEEQRVSEQVRKEDVEIEKQGEADRIHGGETKPGDRLRQYEERPRSKRR